MLKYAKKMLKKKYIYTKILIKKGFCVSEFFLRSYNKYVKKLCTVEVVQQKREAPKEYDKTKPV